MYMYRVSKYFSGFQKIEKGGALYLIEYKPE